MKVEKSMLNKCLSILSAVKVKNSVSENYRRFSPHSGRALSRRSSLAIVAVVGALTAFWLAGADVWRSAQAAQTPQTPAATPTPTGAPDYRNVKDILNGRRSLLRSDDLTLIGILNNSNELFSTTLKTKGGQINESSPSFRIDYSYTFQTQMGRMFAFDADVMATVNWVAGRLNAHATSPTAKATESLEINSHFSGQSNIAVFASKMADFNGDGFDDMVVNYGVPGGQSALQIINAQNVNAFSEGLIARGENLQARNMGVHKVFYDSGKLHSPGSDTMTVGDFNGDGRLEIIGVVPGEGDKGLQLELHTVDEKTLQISDAIFFPLNIGEDDKPVPFSHIAPAVGRFTVTSHDQLLIAYAINEGTAKVKLVDFNQLTFEPLERSSWDSGDQIKTGDFFHRGLEYHYAGLLKLKVGRIEWSSQFDQAVLLHGNNKYRYTGTNSYDDFTISYLAIGSADGAITEQDKFIKGGDWGNIFDMTLGNFDNRSPDPLNSNQTERNPNLQVALLSTDWSGTTATVDIFNVNRTTSKLEQFSNYSILQEAPTPESFRFVAGDMQGRSMRLGEPTKVTVYGTVQPSVLTAAPPMHVDHMADIDGKPQDILNVSAVPKDFYAFYDTETKNTNQSSSTHTTSWSFGAKETAGFSVSVGSVKKGNGSKMTDTFKAGQDLKRSTENTHGTYSSEEFDISTKTVFSDTVQYSQSNFNIYIYPVIGQTVCPASKADDNGNCLDSDKKPLTVQFSGPDQIHTDVVGAETVEWYQPVWEYGNILSYPGSSSQLQQQIFPGLKQLSNDYSFATDSLKGTFKTSWKKGNSTAVNTSSSNNYSYDNNYSTQGAFGIDGGFTVGYSFGLDLNGSTGFGDLTKSTISLGKSTGVGVEKNAEFPAPTDYNYSISSYIFGREKPGGSVDEAPSADAFGFLQSAFTVDPLRESAGGWWRQSYGAAPDLALNHPTRWEITTRTMKDPLPPDCLSTEGAARMNCAELGDKRPENPWNSNFHSMRGFFISNITNGNPPGQGPQLETANAGDKLALQARVYNYSLKEMNPDAKVHVRFYGMEWNKDSNTPAGDSFLIGEDVTGRIPAFNTGDKLNWVLADTTFDTTPYADKYLVFWVVVWSQEANGNLTAELPDHGLTAVPSVLKNLVDAHQIEAEYSNNVGFYRSHFHVLSRLNGTRFGATRQSGTANNAGDIQLLNVKVSENRLDFGREVSANLRARRIASGLSVVFYDGDPQQGGKPFDIERIPHIRANDTYQVKVSFKPKTCDERRIFVTVGRGTPFEVSGASRKIKVGCGKE
jgi:hypothetical protein